MGHALMGHAVPAPAPRPQAAFACTHLARSVTRAMPPSTATHIVCTRPVRPEGRTFSPCYGGARRHPTANTPCRAPHTPPKQYTLTVVEAHLTPDRLVHTSHAPPPRNRPHHALHSIGCFPNKQQTPAGLGTCRSAAKDAAGGCMFEGTSLHERAQHCSHWVPKAVKC